MAAPRGLPSSLVQLRGAPSSAYRTEISGHTRCKTETSAPASPFGQVSASDQRVSPNLYPTSQRVGNCMKYKLPFFRSGTNVQADLLSFCQNHISGQAPLLHGNYPASSLLWACPTPEQDRPRVIDSPWNVEVKSSSCRASQVPRSIFQCAPSPTTPKSPTNAYTCCFSAGYRLHPIRQAGHSQLRNEAESSSLALRLTLSSTRGFSGQDYSIRCPSDYIDKQAISMAGSFQPARLTRLGLAHLIFAD